MPDEQKQSNKPKEPLLKVYKNRSVLVDQDGNEEIFFEGNPTKGAKARLAKIRKAFEAGFLPNLIEKCKKPDAENGDLAPGQIALLDSLVGSVTSERGRAVVGLAVLQLSVKTVCPEQSVRLHKSGGHGTVRFSWAEGVPMRVLDKNYNTPALRKHGLLRLNADGVMMTRSLAENYPYSGLYKAAIRGARDDWFKIVDLAESGELNSDAALKHIITLLLNRSEEFQKQASAALQTVQGALDAGPSAIDVIAWIATFVEASPYSARVFEVALHSLFQALEDQKALEGRLAQLSQMRSANKKHGNIADIEVTLDTNPYSIIEAWDAKYGKPYLWDELGELGDKLELHPETELAGFVVDREPEIKPEVSEKIEEIEETHGVKIQIEKFDKWAKAQLARGGSSADELARDWLLAFAESLCQQRRDRAPIDEPSDAWVVQLKKHAKAWKSIAQKSGQG